MRGVTKGRDDLHGPAAPTPLLHRPLQRPIARRRAVHTYDDDVVRPAHDDLHYPCSHARLTSTPEGRAKGPSPSVRPRPDRRSGGPALRGRPGERGVASSRCATPVSYTHLTLPTN